MMKLHQLHNLPLRNLLLPNLPLPNLQVVVAHPNGQMTCTAMMKIIMQVVIMMEGPVVAIVLQVKKVQTDFRYDKLNSIQCSVWFKNVLLNAQFFWDNNCLLFIDFLILSGFGSVKMKIIDFVKKYRFLFAYVHVSCSSLLT